MIEKWRLNGELHSIMATIQENDHGIIPLGTEVDKRFNVYRSFWRGATTRAKEMEVDESIIEMNNRWRKWQNKQGSLPNLPMSQLYVEITQALSTKLRFSRSLYVTGGRCKQSMLNCLVYVWIVLWWISRN